MNASERPPKDSTPSNPRARFRASVLAAVIVTPILGGLGAAMLVSARDEINYARSVKTDVLTRVLRVETATPPRGGKRYTPVLGFPDGRVVKLDHSFRREDHAPPAGASYVARCAAPALLVCRDPRAWVAYAGWPWLVALLSFFVLVLVGVFAQLWRSWLDVKASH